MSARESIPTHWSARDRSEYKRWQEYLLGDRRPTCRMTVSEYPPDCVFYPDHTWTDPVTGEEHHGELVPENAGMANARPGLQRGTFFATTLTREHPVYGTMPVWYWGGVHPEDRARGLCAGGMWLDGEE